MKIRQTITQRFALLALVAMAGLVLGGCVSSRVSESDFAEPLPEHIDPEKRAQAVAEMRQKGAATGTAPPSAYVEDNPELEPKTKAQVTEMRQKLDQTAQQHSSTITDQEVAAKRAELEALRREAASHYENTVSSIEN